MKPYRFIDVLEKLNISERELLLLGCEDKLRFCVSVQNVSIVWYARYRYKKGTSHDPSKLFDFEEPWHLKDIDKRDSLTVTPQCVSDILHEGVAETQFRVPEDRNRIVPDPPPDEIVSFICPLYETKGGQDTQEAKQYQQCNINSLLVKALELECYLDAHQDVINTDEQEVETGGNYFKRDGGNWRIRFNGKNITVEKNVKSLVDIAERLKDFGEQKDFLTTKSYQDSADESQATKIKQEAKRDTAKSKQYAYAVRDREFEQSTERNSKEVHRMYDDALRQGDVKRADEILGQIEKLGIWLRKQYNGALRDDGSIAWQVCFDKNDVDKMKQLHRQSLKRGIKMIRKASNGEELADHLQIYLLDRKNIYSPPQDMSSWSITI